MARTSGHGNPNWTRDELILALDLYLRNGGKAPSKSDQRVAELSQTLRSLPYHREATKNATFRNADGVGFKLLNIRSVATGKGLQNTSKVDREVWHEFGHQPERVAEIAAAIRKGLQQPASVLLEEIEPEFVEGRLLTEIHVRRERNPKLRSALLQGRSKSGFVCEICGMSRFDLDVDLQAALFEAHHIVPLAAAGEKATKLSDLALVCACCHRAIHRLIAKERRWVAIEEARSILNPPNSALHT